MGEKEIKRLASPCRIHLRSYRKRLADSDGISGKAVIDGLIHAGLLQDDSPEFVLQVGFSQFKISPKEQEYTEIIIEVEDRFLF